MSTEKDCGSGKPSWWHSALSRPMTRIYNTELLLALHAYCAPTCQQGMSHEDHAGLCHGLHLNRALCQPLLSRSCLCLVYHWAKAGNRLGQPHQLHCCRNFSYAVTSVDRLVRPCWQPGISQIHASAGALVWPLSLQESSEISISRSVHQIL